MKSLIAATLLLQSPVVHQLPDFGATPTVDLSAIRLISCDKWTGTGFLIADNIMATAAHVAKGTHCEDQKTHKPAVTYYSDDKTDFALMSVGLKGIPYIKYNCSRFKTGQHYASYGYSSYLQNYMIFRQSDIVAMSDYTDENFNVEGVVHPHMRHVFGASVPGHSGGPVIDSITGYAIGMNNAGYMNIFGLANGENYSTELADTILCNRRPS